MMSDDEMLDASEGGIRRPAVLRRLTFTKEETNLETWMPEARGLAAQCWCDEKNSGKEMDAGLAESAARRIAAWMETAALYARNAEYWRKRAETAERAGNDSCTKGTGVQIDSPCSFFTKTAPNTTTSIARAKKRG